MKNKWKTAALYGLAILFLLVFWELLSRQKSLSFALPSVFETAKVLFSIIVTKAFWYAIFRSFVRITEGVLIGFAIGGLLAVLTRVYPVFRTFFSPFFRIIRSAPVVSYILILWVTVPAKNAVPVIIAVFMVLPVVYDGMCTGLSTLDRTKTEVLEIFGIKGKRKYKDFVIPALSPFLFSSLLTSVGLAWKAGISAEIICYTADSIGRNIHHATDTLDYPLLFAWTVTAIILSILVEAVIRYLRGKVVHDGNESR